MVSVWLHQVHFLQSTCQVGSAGLLLKVVVPHQFHNSTLWKTSLATSFDVKGSRGGLPKSGGAETKKKRKQFPKKKNGTETKSGSSDDPKKEMLEMLKARSELSEAQLLEVAPNLDEDLKYDQIQIQNRFDYKNTLYQCTM